jgi:hypothetical protein
MGKALITKNRSWTELAKVLAANGEFRNSNGTFRGEWNHSGAFWSENTGWLPREYVERIQQDRPLYVVWSYATPIAWLGPRGWVIPDVRYSRTTSGHQGKASVAIRNMRDYV